MDLGVQPDAHFTDEPPWVKLGRNLMERGHQKRVVAQVSNLLGRVPKAGTDGLPIGCHWPPLAVAALRHAAKAENRWCGRLETCATMRAELDPEMPGPEATLLPRAILYIP